MLTQAVDPDLVQEVCGENPTFICREVLERTESRRWAEVADIFFAKPLTILLIVVIAWVVNRLARRVITRFERSLAGDTPPSRRLKRKLRHTAIGQRLPESVLDTSIYSARAVARAQTLGVVLRSIVTFAIWTIAAIAILGELGINLGPLVASAGIAGVALGFGAQSLVRDFLAGIFILVEDQYGVGDVIDVGELSGTQVSGTVEAVSLRTTRLRSVDGTVWHVPNGTILRVGNMSQQWARALLDIAVAYGTDIDLAQRVIKETADALAQEPEWRHHILEEPEVWGVESFGADGVIIRLVVKTRPSKQWVVMRALRRRLKLAFHQAGIEMPFPQRTVWIRHAGDNVAEPFDPPPRAADGDGAPPTAEPERAADDEPAAADGTGDERDDGDDERSAGISVPPADESIRAKGAPEEA
ncbi:MAG TPA: mechanosensitive ion channel family protein [Acidimicrobiales bacterium]|nr:mechanosensitive ion channel family protein [Acidimicrobiales bacterium]